MDKPTKPTDLMPRTFGGLKENYSTSLQQTGVEPNVPVIYHGKNFNYEKNAIGQELDYCEKIVDFINEIPIGKTITVDSNNKLQYANLAQDVPIATTETAGIVKPDGETITVDENGVVTAKSMSRNIGEIVASTIPLTDAGLHLLDGALLQYGAYQAFIDYIADLYDSGDYTAIFETEANWQSAVAQYGVCGKFVYDSVSNTVRLPKITGFIEGTIDVNALGDLVEAGLPEITYYNPQGVVGEGLLGALSSNTVSSTHRVTTTSTGSAYVQPVNFKASRSDSTYGNLATGAKNKVQPQSVKVLYYIVVATASKTDIEVDIDEIATDLNGKADVDLSNVTSDIATIPPTGLKNFDGQWIGSLSLLSSATSVGTYTLDLSNYLPNDNYNYEVKIVFYAYCASSNGEYFYYFYNDIMPKTSDIWGYANDGARCLSNTFTFPVSTQRYITYQVTNHSANTVKIHALGYRRIGTNQ